MTAAVIRWAIKIYVVWGLFYCSCLFCFRIWAVWLNTISMAIQRKRLKLIAPSALRYIHAFVYTCTSTHRKHTHTHTWNTRALEFELNDSLLWEKQSDGERGGLQQLISPDAQLLREKRKKASSSINTQGISLIRITGSISSCTYRCTVHSARGRIEDERVM